jgi:hypothetical protein
VGVEQALLIIADIGGYTRFMKLHRTSLAHSQDITGRLLEAVVDASPPLRLVEIEGDAAFLYLPLEHRGGASSRKDTAALALAMHQAFHARQRWMVARNMCICDACRQAGQLKVKFVAHLGEVATQTIKDRTKVVGIDVIAAHRMLKNAVPVPEYVLMSEPIYEQADPATRRKAVGIEQELEGIGTTKAYFVDLDQIALELPPITNAALPGRLRETLGVMIRGLPPMAGIRRSRSARASETSETEAKLSRARARDT